MNLETHTAQKNASMIPARLGDEVLKVRNLTTSFHTSRGLVRAVDDVSLAIRGGEMLALVGESGSGKSVLARSIMRLLPRSGVESSGEILIKGEDLASLSEPQMRPHWGPTVSMIFQDPMTALNPVMRIGDQIVESLRGANTGGFRALRRAAVKALNDVGVSEPERRVQQYPHQLSGGMRQRVMIAIALIRDPQVLVADEPTTALDVTIQAQVMQLLKREQQSRQMSVLFITHDLGLAASYAENVMVMYAGQVVESGPADAVLRSSRTPYASALRNSMPLVKNPPHARLEAIAGRPPDLASLPTGCRFASRCAYSQERCLKEEPQLVSDNGREDHKYRCFFPVGLPEGDAALRANRAKGTSASGVPVGELKGSGAIV
ncbi:ABC transporter ATP-binding protein [Pseudarthrobacter siccitolerans]|uniref:ABC transporter ATP-binding protein n=1 Tax=Pseudarthrobacter siccitolerans TaxID=861266 RepID=UPI0019109E8E|nr:ABC transporter ATP-binding protein [Pseudarthrobacter siccitolerans]